VTQPALPFTGRAPMSRHCSYRAAVAAGRDRGRKTAVYLAHMETQGELGATDHEAAAALRYPLSSINSIRNGAIDRLVAAGKRPGPYGQDCTVWRVVR
jgi:hypothetical protein